MCPKTHRYAYNPAGNYDSCCASPDGNRPWEAAYVGVNAGPRESRTMGCPDGQSVACATKPCLDHSLSGDETWSPTAPPTAAPEVSSNWVTISTYNACEQNTNGISRTFGGNGYTMDSCKIKCQSDDNCVAIDYYGDQNTVSGWCNTFDQACTNPTRWGGKSYKWTRP